MCVNTIENMAKHPERRIMEKSTFSVDQFGQPQRTTIIEKVSEKEKEEEEKKEADTKNMF